MLPLFISELLCVMIKRFSWRTEAIKSSYGPVIERLLSTGPRVTVFLLFTYCWWNSIQYFLARSLSAITKIFLSEEMHWVTLNRCSRRHYPVLLLFLPFSPPTLQMNSSFNFTKSPIRGIAENWVLFPSVHLRKNDHVLHGVHWHFNYVAKVHVYENYDTRNIIQWIVWLNYMMFNRSVLCTWFH